MTSGEFIAPDELFSEPLVRVGVEGRIQSVNRGFLDGRSAVETADAYRPDILLIDLGMPHLSGFEVARIIGSRSWAASAVLIALTGWGQDADRSRALAAGFSHHLVKPVSLETLATAFEPLEPVH